MTKSHPRFVTVQANALPEALPRLSVLTAPTR
jgi:hypothetical protein